MADRTLTLGPVQGRIEGMHGVLAAELPEVLYTVCQAGNLVGR
jgi:hypothetical protein